MAPVDAVGTLEGRLVRLEPLGPAYVDDLAEAAAVDRASYDFTTVPAGRDAMVSYVAEIGRRCAPGSRSVWPAAAGDRQQVISRADGPRRGSA